MDTTRELLRHNADRSIEWFSALAMLVLATILVMPGDTMAGPSFREFDHYGLNEARLAAALGIVGAVRVVALWINGRWPRGPMLRIGGSVIGAMIWGQIAWLITLGALLNNGTISTDTGIYTLLAIGEILSIYKAAFDARYERG